MYTPVHSANLLLRIGRGPWWLSYQYNSYSERFTTSSNDLTGRNRLYPYFMNDLGTGWSFRLGETTLQLEGRIFNLFNERYESVLFRPMPGRNAQLTLRLVR
ncbi:MAG: hypothetical protein R2751_12860 [Bacteroidales bacterium]